MATVENPPLYLHLQEVWTEVTSSLVAFVRAATEVGDTTALIHHSTNPTFHPLIHSGGEIQRV